MISKLSMALFSFVLLYFAYLGLITTPVQLREVDSLTYHIPVAESFAQGNFLDLSHIRTGLGYYPAASEIVLAVFVKLGIPLGFFNVLGLILLFFLTKHLALRLGLDKRASLVFATSVSLLPTIVRLVPNQKVDIWLTVFFLWCLYLLQKPKNNISYFLKLGLSFGLLTGAKYSGILFAAVLLVVYLNKLLPLLSLKKIVAFFVPFAIFGLSWFVRNYFLVGNPFYPVSMFIWKGHSSFRASAVTKTLFDFPGGLLLTVESFMSEYLIWALAPAGILLLRIFKDFKPLILLGFANFLIYLILPSGITRQATVSNLRFTYVAMIPLILVIFLAAKQKKLLEKLKPIAFLNAVAVLPQLSYRPKLVVLWLMLFLILIFKPK